MAWRYNPFTDTFQYYNAPSDLEGNFLKLDATNGPLTGKLTIKPDSGDTALDLQKDLVLKAGQKFFLDGNASEE